MSSAVRAPAVPLPPTALRSAADRIRDHVVRTPLVRLPIEDAPRTIWLKLETLQPVGSFKLRGAANAILQAPRERLAQGIVTASAGNMAQGVGWMARALGVPFTVVVPDHAPDAKLAAIRRLGGRLIAVPFDDWWRVLIDHRHAGLDGVFVHPVTDPAVMAGNGTIGLEIAEDLPDADAVIVPFGGGGLVCGIASALGHVSPRTRVFAAEVATAAPLRAALAAGRPTAVPYAPSFVDGIGSRAVLDEMWPLLMQLVGESLVVSLEQVADAIRLLAGRSRVVAEGAGAAAVAAALAGGAGIGNVVCIVSGGSIDVAKLATILAGRLP